MHTRRVHLMFLAIGLAAVLTAVVIASASASRPTGEILPAQPSALLAQPALPQALNFQIECADCPRQFDYSTDRYLRLDSLGYPHLAYGRDHLYYAWNDGTNWHSEIADPAYLVGSSASLALTASGAPRIAYLDTLNGKLKYAYRDASGWHAQTLAEASYGNGISIALDNSGYAHISFWDQADLIYASQDANGWNFEVAATISVYGSSNSLALDKAGNPHISYWNQVDDSLNYAYKTISGWHQLTVDDMGNMGEYNSIAVDDSGLVHISYYDSYPNYDLKYAVGDANGFQVSLVDSVDGVGMYNSIAVTPEGVPSISYMADDTLRYATLSGAAWQTATLDSGGLIGGFTSIALNNSGKARIAYYDQSISSFGYKIMYIDQTGAGWDEPELVDSGSSVGAFSSLALDAQGFPHISYMDETYNDLKYAYQDSDGWHQATVDGDYVVGLYTSLALDKHGYPHISYTDFTHDQIKYIYQDAGGWSIPFVLDGGAATGYPSSLALDSLGYAHIIYYRSDTKTLRYAYQDASGWHYANIEYVGNVMVDSSLVLDENDILHISYFYVPSEDLHYATLQGNLWITQTVDYTGSVGSTNDLALDENGNAYIAYSDDSNRDLKFARQTGGGWQIETVDGYGLTGTDPSIAIDSSGAAHISYTGDLCVGPCGRLKYAENNSGAWITQTLTPAGQYSTGFYSSIALYNDQPRISFHDRAIGDLKYVSTLAPITAVSLNGAISGALGVAYPFTATIQPANASLPITTTWQASGQETLVQVGGAQQTLSYTWDVPGMQLITVTAQNPASLVTATHVITISEAPIVGLSASNDSPTVLGKPTTLSASVTSGSSLSYAWQFGDGESGIGQVVQHTYAAPGSYTATVTASNSLGQAQATTLVRVVVRAYLPLVPDGEVVGD